MAGYLWENNRGEGTLVFAEAQAWYARAVAEKGQGDVYGRVDHSSVENSRARLGDY